MAAGWRPIFIYMSEALLAAFQGVASSNDIGFVSGTQSVYVDGSIIFAIATAYSSSYTSTLYGGSGVVTSSITSSYFTVVQGANTYRATIIYTGSTKYVSASCTLSSGAPVSFIIVAAYTKN